MTTDPGVLTLMDVAGCDIMTASQYLQATDNDVSAAVALFFEANDGGDGGLSPNLSSVPNATENGWEAGMSNNIPDASFPGEVIYAPQPDVSGDAELARRLAVEINQEAFNPFEGFGRNDGFEGMVNTMPAGGLGQILNDTSRGNMSQQSEIRRRGEGAPHLANLHQESSQGMPIMWGQEWGGAGMAGKTSSTPAIKLPHKVRDAYSVSFEAVCKEAKQRNLWVLIFFHDNSIFGSVAQTVLWANSGTQMLHEMCLCYDVNVKSPTGSQLHAEYNVMDPQAPFACIVVHPITQHKIVEAPQVWKNRTESLLEDVMDAENEVETSEPERLVQDIIESFADELVSFVVEHLAEEGCPFSSGEKGEREKETEKNTTSPALSTSTSPSSPPPDPSPKEKEIAQTEVKSTGIVPGSSSSPPSQIITSLEEFEVPPSKGEDAFKLRFQFPKSILDIQLKKSTPVKAIMNYCAYRLHRENRETFPTVPTSPYLLAGYPPRRIDKENILKGNNNDEEEVTLATCSNIRSGDKVLVRA